MAAACICDRDAAMAARKQSKAEATEEYLADFAAQLDVSLVARIWNAIKGALNKLGVEFGPLCSVHPTRFGSYKDRYTL